MAVGHLADTQAADMTRPTEMVQGEVTGLRVIVIAMGTARESMAGIGTETVTEKAGVIDEAKVKNSTESLLPEGKINPMRRRGGAVEGEKVGSMYHRHHLHIHLHLQRRYMARMNGEELGLATLLEVELHKDRVEAAIAGASTTETARDAVGEMMTCLRESIQEVRKVLRMAVVAVEGEVDGWQVIARGLGEDRERICRLVGVQVARFFTTSGRELALLALQLQIEHLARSSGCRIVCPPSV